MAQPREAGWTSTACPLCSLNCGLEVRPENGRLAKIRGDKQHPLSEGYLCQKAARLDYYQNHERRLRHPLRRRPDGSFERIDWDTAINEVAARLKAVRDEHGGHAIAYYGGGGQGNHLGGAYAVPFRAALETPYVYNALAQEKTGDFWVNGKLFGRQTCHLTEEIHHADYAIILGANPWQAHGIPKAREVLRAFKKDPNRTLVVVDPRRTVTAEYADIHLQVRPGTDAFLMTAMLGTMIQESLENRAFLDEHTVGFDELREQLHHVPVNEYAERAGCDPAVVRKIASDFARARAGCTRHDLGLEQSLHSTLNTYLEKLLALIPGHFGKPGTINLHTQFAPLVGHSKETAPKTRVTGMRQISKFYPPNVLPSEIDTDHPERLRALFVDSGNPLQTAADTHACRRAFKKLDLLVVVDVAMTETAEAADYILPGPTQLEKTEATFFTLSFPTNYFHVRRPVLKAPQGDDTLPEPEIYRRLLVALSEIPDRFPLLERAARWHMKRPSLGIFPKALGLTIARNPKWKRYAATILYATLGKALPDRAESAAVLWGTCQFYAKRYPEQVRRTGLSGGSSAALGEALFQRIMHTDTAIPISTHTHDEVWQLVLHEDGKIHLAIPEMLTELAALAAEPVEREDAASFPFILAAGERRAYNANQIYRDPAWRKSDRDGALRIHPEDATNLGLSDGDRVRCESAVGAVEVAIERDDAMRPGCLSLPHGFGMQYPDADGRLRQNGAAINELTESRRCDPLARTPWHKYVPVRLARLGGREV
ncbi:dehydrogenase [Acidobacteria bacterium Mor1]|nr:dehydrogenase [Acidobacteria bacterium Mor1]